MRLNRYEDGIRVIDKCWYDPELGLLLTQSELLKRGWTKSRIEKELGNPDRLGINPHGGARVRLYSEARAAGPDEDQIWYDTVQEIVTDFVTNFDGDNDDLGYTMLDVNSRFWDEAHDDGLSPQEALEKYQKELIVP